MSSLQDYRERKLRLGMGPRPNILPFPPAFPPVQVEEPKIVPISIERDKKFEQIQQELKTMERRIRELQLESNMDTDAPVITPRIIILTVAKYYGVAVTELQSQRRHTYVVHPRHVAMYLIKHLTSLSMPAIGRALGGRDHTTVMNGCSKLEKSRKTDSALDIELKELTALLTGEPTNV